MPPQSRLHTHPCCATLFPPARAAKPPATVPRQACPGGLLQGRSAARAALGVAPSRRQRAFPACSTPQVRGRHVEAHVSMF
eukprot:349919-Chlamydomonas_euryale.AAC.3